ncbi:hypothetical protein BGZ98_005112 [Dissophora globulifera]|nr:hypothetical protein BGZ98_005112 [Dissophora globulifera]
MRQRNYDALSVLHKLETLHLGRFAIDHERLCEAVLRRNAASLKELSLQGMLGFDSEDAWGPITREPHSDEDNQSGNHQRGDESAMTVSARSGILLSNLKTLRLNCTWDETTFSLSSLGMDSFDDEGFGLLGDEDDQNSADELHDDDDEDNSFYTVIKTDNFALPGLFRCCPSLEILIWQPRERMDMNKISRLLREYCPRLDTIRRLDGFTLFKDGLSSNEGDCVLLIQGCTPPLSPQFTASSPSTDDAAVSSGTEREVREQGLKHFEMGIWLLDMAITSAFLVHASSLQDIKLSLGGDEKINIENAARLLQLCPRLKRLNVCDSSGLRTRGEAYFLRMIRMIRMIKMYKKCRYRHSQRSKVRAMVYNRAKNRPNQTSATAASKIKYNAFTPTHWRNVWKPSFGGERRLTSASGIVFRRALFERADSMPNLVHLVLNERHYKKMSQTGYVAAGVHNAHRVS